MTTRHRIVPNLYKDSVALMAISSKLLAIEGLDGASVVMATPTNLENLVAGGLGGNLTTKPSDLVGGLLHSGHFNAGGSRPGSTRACCPPRAIRLRWGHDSAP